MTSGNRALVLGCCERWNGSIWIRRHTLLSTNPWEHPDSLSIRQSCFYPSLFTGVYIEYLSLHHLFSLKSKPLKTTTEKSNGYRKFFLLIQKHALAIKTLESIRHPGLSQIELSKICTSHTDCICWDILCYVLVIKTKTVGAILSVSISVQCRSPSRSLSLVHAKSVQLAGLSPIWCLRDRGSSCLAMLSLQHVAHSLWGSTSHMDSHYLQGRLSLPRGSGIQGH